MREFDRDDGVSRRKVLECMTWAGTGVLWTRGRRRAALARARSARRSRRKRAGLTFLQISDSHVGFDKPANPNALGTLEEAIGKINALPVKPAFMIHTGDISHLSKASQFDDADRIISQTRLDVHYVPGEHDFLDEEMKLYRERYGRGTKGAGWYSFDANGVHFIGLVNVVDLKAGGLGNLGAEQLEWLEDDLKGRSASTPIVVFAHIPLWTVYPEWGWGTDDGAQALSYSQALRLGDGAQRPHPPGDAEGRGQRHLPHRALDRVPAAGAGHCAFARTDESRRRQAAHAARHRQHHVQARTISASRSSTRRCRARERSNAMRNKSVRNVLVRAPLLGAMTAPVLSAASAARRARTGRAGHGHDRQLHLQSAAHDGENRHHRHLDQQGRYPARGGGDGQSVQIESAGYRQQLLVHVHHAGDLSTIFARCIRT